MKSYLVIFSIFVSLISSAQVFSPSTHQMVINVERQDFKPLREANWRVMVGNSSLATDDADVSRGGNGLGIGLEKIVSDRWSVGGYFSNIRANVTEKWNWEWMDAEVVKKEYRQSVSVLSAHGKYSFVNYPVNKWNLIQVSLLGGVMAVERLADQPTLIYGAAASYNYDNLIGFELNTKVNIRAEASTSANLVGYF